MIGVLVVPDADRCFAGREARVSSSSVVTVYVVSGAAAAVALGAFLGLVGSALPGVLTSDWSSWLLGCAALLFAAVDAGFVRVTLPSARRPVPHAWRLRGRIKAALMYGAALSVGFGTPIYGAAYYVLPPAAILLGSPLLGGLLFMAYSLGRSVPLIVAATHPQRRSALLHGASIPGLWETVLVYESLLLAFVAGRLIAHGVDLSR